MGTGTLEEKKEKLIMRLGIKKKTAKIILDAYKAMSRATSDSHSRAERLTLSDPSDVLETGAPLPSGTVPQHQPGSSTPLLSLDLLYPTEG